MASSGRANYYVSPLGNDKNAGTKAHPFKTLNHAVGLLGPGRTLWVMPGTYHEYLDSHIPAGTSWKRPVTIRAANPFHPPVLLSPYGPVAACSNPVCCAAQTKATGRPCFHGDAVHLEGKNERFIILSGLVIDARHVQRNGLKLTAGASYIRVENSEIMNAPKANGVLISNTAPNNPPNSEHNQLIGDDVHNNGTTRYDHGVYLDSGYNLILRCRIHDNFGWGVHSFNGYSNPNDIGNLVVDNDIYRNGIAQGSEGAGIGLFSAKGLVAFDNVLWGNYIGIEVAYDANGARVYNNTVMSSAANGIYVFASAPNVRIANNIVVKSGTAGIRTDATSTTIRNNDLFGNGKDEPQVPAGARVQAGNLVSIDPRLSCNNCANPKLLPGSPALRSGTRIPSDMPIIPGGPRPSNPKPNIGAYRG